MVKEVLKKGPNSLQKNFVCFFLFFFKISLKSFILFSSFVHCFKEGKRAIDMVPSFPLSNVQIQSNLRHYDLQFRKVFHFLFFIFYSLSFLLHLFFFIFSSSSFDLIFSKFEILRFIHEEREPRSYLSWLPAHLFSSLRETYFSPTPSLSYGLYEEQRPNFEEEWLSSICDLQSQQIDYLIQVLEKERINSRVLMERVRDLEGKKLS